MRKLWLIAVVSLCTSALFGANTLNGAGATFPYPIYSKWFSEYNKVHPDVQINYQSIGSGGGIRQLQQGTVDFGASDMPLTEEQMKQMPMPVVQLPTVLGSVVPVYNVPEIKTELKFTAQVLAGIYLGQITTWNDKAIAAANPGVNLPYKPIIVVHRSDGSGTTFVFTDYLCKTSPEWKAKIPTPNTSVSWPIGLGGKGNEGVAGQVRQMDGAIGYVELVYALQNKIPFGSMKNAAGQFVKASLQSTTAAGASVKTIPPDFRMSITNAAGNDAYPISSFTYLLVPKQWKDANKGKIMVDFLNWMLTNGQGMVQNLDYAPLPSAIQEKETAVVKQIR